MNKLTRLFELFLLLILLVLFSGCALNPVTGEQQLMRRTHLQHEGITPPGSDGEPKAPAAGQYNHCRCCGEPLFDSRIKFESKSGWPSFTEPVSDHAIKYEKDTSFGMVRVEAMCNVCDAHLGHVFPDGPPPTGLRFCINSESIRLAKVK